MSHSLPLEKAFNLAQNKRVNELNNCKLKLWTEGNKDVFTRFH